MLGHQPLQAQVSNAVIAMGLGFSNDPPVQWHFGK